MYIWVYSIVDWDWLFLLCQGWCALSSVGLSKHIRWPDPPETRPELIQNQPTRPTPVVGGRFSSPEIDFGGLVSISLPKNLKKPIIRQKTQIPARNPDFYEKILDSSNKTPRSRLKNLDSGTILRRSNKILSESSEISSNLVRLPSDLVKSHRFRWDFCQIWVSFHLFSQFPRPFLLFSQIFNSDRPVHLPIEVWSAQPVYSDDQRHVSFFKTRFSRVNSRLGTNST